MPMICIIDSSTTRYEMNGIHLVLGSASVGQLVDELNWDVMAGDMCDSWNLDILLELKRNSKFFGFMLEFAVLVVQMNHCLPPKLTIAVISRMDYSLRTTLMPSCHDQNALPKLNRTTLIFDLPLQLPATSIQSNCNLHLHRVRPTSQILHLHKSLHVNLKQIDSIYQTMRTRQI